MPKNDFNPTRKGTLDKVKKSVASGALTAENFDLAITASQDNQQVAEYLNSITPEYDSAIPKESEIPYGQEFDAPVEEEFGIPVDAVEEDVLVEEFGLSAVDANAEISLGVTAVNRVALGQSVDLNSTDPEIQFVNEVAQKNEATTMDLAITRFSPEQIDKWKNNPIGFSEADRFVTAADMIPLGSVVTGYELGKLAMVAEKIRNGKEISESEESQFNEWLDLHIEKQIRGFSWQGGMAYYGSQIPAFMVEFALTSGVGKTAQVAAKQAITKGVMTSVETAAVAKLAGQAASGAARVVAMSPIRASGTYGRERLGQKVQLTTDGMAVLTEARERPAVTALRAFAYTGAEVLSEMSGGVIGRNLVNPIVGRLKTKAITSINKLPPKLVDGLLKSYQMIQPNAVLSDIITRVGWHGMINELGEERVADALTLYADMAFGETYTADEIWDRLVPSKDQFLLEAGLISIPGGAKTLGALTGNLMSGKGHSQEQVDTVLNTALNDELANYIEAETYVEDKPDLQVALNEKYLDEGGPAKVAEVAVTESLLLAYDKSIEPANVKKKQGIIKGLVAQAKAVNKKATKFKDFIAAGGPLDVKQLISEGFDPKDLEDGKVKFGKNLKRVWSLQNPQQTISQLTERYNEELSLFDGDVVADKSRELSDNDMISMLMDWVNSDSPQTFLIDPVATAELDQINMRLDDIDQVPESELQEYFDNMYMEYAEESGTQVPVEVESFSGVDSIEYASSASEAEFQNEINELDLYLDGLNNRISEEAYNAQTPALYDQITEQEIFDGPIPILDHTQSIGQSLLTDWHTKFAPIEAAVKLAENRKGPLPKGQNPTLLISTFGGIAGKLQAFLEHSTYTMTINGEIVKTGVGYKPILDGFDSLILSTEPNKKQRKADLEKYLISRRITQDLQNFTIPSTGEEIVGPVTERRISAEQALQAELDMAALRIKYGDSIQYFDNTAEALYAFQKRVLHLLVDSGNMSKEKFDQIMNDNPNYVPFHRVMVSQLFEGAGLTQAQITEALSVLTETEIEEISESKIIGQEQYDKIVASNLNIADAIKPISGSTGLSGKPSGLFTGAKSQWLTQRFKGSERAVKGPLYSIIKSTMAVLDVAARNTIARSIGDLHSYMPEYIQKVNPAPLYDSKDRVVKDADGNTVMNPIPPIGAMEVYKDGKKQYYKVPKPILDALTGMTTEQLNFVNRFLIEAVTLPITTYRVGATISPEFIASIVWRDQFAAPLLSGTSANPIDMVRGITAIMGKTDLYYEWLATGGSMAGYMDVSDTGMIDAYKDLMNDEGYLLKLAKSGGFKPLKDLLKVTDQSVRIGIYLASKRQGLSNIESAVKGREGTVDFNKSGVLGKKVNKWNPFFNVGIQSVIKLATAAKENPKAFSLLALSTITLPSLLLAGYYLFDAPDDEREEWLNIPQWIKDGHWVWKSDGEWHQQKKPYAPGYIFGSIPEKFLTWTYEGDKPEGKAFYEEHVKGFIAATLPFSNAGSILPPPVRSALEWNSNYSFFKDRAEYPDWMDNLEPELRSGSYTTDTAKLLGEQFNVSPAKVDALLKNTFATGAKYMTNAGDRIIREMAEYKNQPLPEKPDSAKNELFWGAFVVNSPRSLQSITGSNLYKIADDVKMKESSVARFSEEKAEAYKEKHEFVFDQARMIKRALKKVTAINKQVKEIRADEGYTGKEKEKIIIEYDIERYDIAKEAVGEYVDGLKSMAKE